MAPPLSSSEPPYDPVENKIGPSILLIIVIVAIFFFVSGLLHLLVRYLLRPTILLTTRGSDDYLDDSTDVYNAAATAIQGQLQQLFHLHDAGVDQSFIDALPVFPYGSIVGSSRRRTQLKDPFDCAVCLCEFDPDDKLRLLPNCSHAFHTGCIDTWLLSHSTCPLCRTTLLSSPGQCSSSSSTSTSMVSESFGEIGGGDDNMETQRRRSSDGEEMEVNSEERGVVQVKLGKFRSSADVDIGGGSNLDCQRRCFSMGSYEYQVNDDNPLRVAIKPPPSSMKEQEYHDGSRTRRLAVSECDCHSRRELDFRGISSTSTTTKRVDLVNKFWLRSKKQHDFSLGLPALPSESKAKSAVSEEWDVSSKWEKNGSENMDLDVEVGSCNNSVLSMGSQIERVPSFTRRTLLWIVGRQQNRVGSMS